jgi:hypothetical protein
MVARVIQHFPRQLDNDFGVEAGGTADTLIASRRSTLAGVDGLCRLFLPFGYQLFAQAKQYGWAIHFSLANMSASH